MARILWIEPNGTRYDVIRHVSALQSLRNKVDWIAANFRRGDWPHVEISYWHTMADLLEGKPCEQWEVLLRALWEPSIPAFDIRTFL